jgi:hypothetical protein
MCFSLASVLHLIIIIVLVIAGFLILRVLLGMASRFVGEFAWLLDGIVAIVRIVIIAAVVIAIGLFVFELLACVVPAAIR